MKILGFLFAAAALLLQCDTPGETYFVDVDHPRASDDGPGTEARPWKTMVHAAATARSGDLVWVKEGVYDHGEVKIEHSGIVLSAYPGHERRAIVRGAGLVSRGNSNLLIHGFKFEHTPSHGIRIQGPNARNITVLNNHTYDTYNSGISIRGVSGNADPGDYDNMRNVFVVGNLLELGTHGGSGEVLSVASGVVNIDVAYNELRMGDPDGSRGDEGISFKEGVRDSRIHNNVVHGLSNKGIHIDGGSTVHDPQITGIEVFGNLLYDLPTHGMWVTTEGRGDVDGVYVHHNIAHNVDGDGFLVYQHPDGAADGGTVKNVWFDHNTVWRGGQRGRGFGGFRVNHPTATGIAFTNNIAWGNVGYDMRGESGTVFWNNLCQEASLCEVTERPLFQSPPASFELRPDSPALGAGSGGTNLGAE